MCCRNFGFEIQSQTEVTVRKPKKSNMATRRPFWKWHIWKSIGFFPYTLVVCYCSFDLIFKAKQKLESGNKKIQYARQAAILKVTLLKINRLLTKATNNMHMKHQIEIPKQTWVMLQNHVAYRRTDIQTDRQTEKVIPVYPPPPPPPPPPTSLGGGIKINNASSATAAVPESMCSQHGWMKHLKAHVSSTGATMWEGPSKAWAG